MALVNEICNQPDPFFHSATLFLLAVSVASVTGLALAMLCNARYKRHNAKLLGHLRRRPLTELREQMERAEVLELSLFKSCPPAGLMESLRERGWIR